MTISLIVAMDRNKCIGKNNTLPWHIPADLKYFKEKTIGKTVVMGRNTYESIGKPLPKRDNIVLSTSEEFLKSHWKDVFVYGSIDHLLHFHNKKDEELMIIGGSEVYKQFLQLADKLYITHINHTFDGDTYFPEYDESDFEIEFSNGMIAQGDNPYDLIFARYKRIKQ